MHSLLQYFCKELIRNLIISVSRFLCVKPGTYNNSGSIIYCCMQCTLSLSEPEVDACIHLKLFAEIFWSWLGWISCSDIRFCFKLNKNFFCCFVSFLSSRRCFLNSFFVLCHALTENSSCSLKIRRTSHSLIFMFSFFPVSFRPSNSPLNYKGQNPLRILWIKSLTN